MIQLTRRVAWTIMCICMKSALELRDSLRSLFVRSGPNIKVLYGVRHRHSFQIEECHPALRPSFSN